MFGQDQAQIRTVEKFKICHRILDRILFHRTFRPEKNPTIEVEVFILRLKSRHVRPRSGEPRTIYRVLVAEDPQEGTEELVLTAGPASELYVVVQPMLSDLAP